MNCPSCGGALDWDQRFAHLVVCPYCSSSVVVDEQALRVAGKMNVLAAPDGLLAVGASGTVHGRAFRVLGRVRYGYARGVWDEWYVLFGVHETAWIAQDEEGYTLEELRSDVDAPERLRGARPGDLVHLGNKAFHVDERDRAVCEGGEGQLPFDLEPGHAIEYLDLSSADRFATVEIEDDGVRVFVGRTLAPASIQVDFGGAVAAPAAAETPADGSFRRRVVRDTRRAVDLKCLSCAHPLPEVTSGDDEVACTACGAVADLSAPRIDCAHCGEAIPVYGDEAAAVLCVFCNAQQALESGVPRVVEILKERKRRGPKWTLPLGRKGTLRGVPRQVVGHLRFVETDEGMRYWSDEFLLHTPGRGYSWLVCENGHFALSDEVKGITKSPRSLRQKQSFQAVGRTWRVFEKGTCELAWVDGELPWVAHVGDTNGYVDCISPPYLLSAEVTDTEAEWFRAEYVPREEIASAFALPLASLPKATGVAPHQPYARGPFRSAVLRVMPVFAAVFLLLLLLHGCTAGRTVARAEIPAPGHMDGHLTDWFEVAQPSAVCSIDLHANVDNGWIWVGGAVVDEAENVVLEFGEDVSYYHGVEGGESWSEGSRSDEVVFRLDEPGRYRLLLDGEAGSGETGSGEAGPPLTLVVREGVVLARYYVILLVLTLIWTGGELLHAASFESRRWSAVLED